ncbi:MAG TPA: MBL fold metallo-hydrolase [Cyclobacteriaceae bacterium]|nr:MBL fold metallo-hydrolase [Cyclobacteriaceae bacterium]
MKITVAVFAACLAGISTFAQRPAPDKISTNKGDLTVQPVLHGSLVLQWNGQTLYVDPFGGGEAFAGLADPNLILITDIHGDHMNVETLDALNTQSAKLVVPQAVAEQLPASYKDRLVVVGNGDETQIGEITIRAIPMYNLPDDASSRHPKGRGNGYVLELGGKRVYLSGDTEDIPEMRQLKDIDVAFVCMNLPYTMDINQAASAVLEFQPAIVYPYHYRGQGGLADVDGFRQLVEKGGKKIEVRLRNWYPGQ